MYINMTEILNIPTVFIAGYFIIYDVGDYNMV